ncbi:hypothetical protein MICRO116_410008 [Micrococcus sp. 116]|nr:hypothetical protein MICRO116_410008 [Micrococcus sp. 116]
MTPTRRDHTPVKSRGQRVLVAGPELWSVHSYSWMRLILDGSWPDWCCWSWVGNFWCVGRQHWPDVSGFRHW